MLLAAVAAAHAAGRRLSAAAAALAALALAAAGELQHLAYYGRAARGCPPTFWAASKPTRRRPPRRWATTWATPTSPTPRARSPCSKPPRSPSRSGPRARAPRRRRRPAALPRRLAAALLDGGDQHFGGSIEDTMRAPWIEARRARPRRRRRAAARLLFRHGPRCPRPGLRASSSPAPTCPRAPSRRRPTPSTGDRLRRSHNRWTRSASPLKAGRRPRRGPGPLPVRRLGASADADYEAMRHVRFVRLTLRGEHRMLWLRGVRVTAHAARLAAQPAARPAVAAAAAAALGAARPPQPAHGARLRHCLGPALRRRPGPGRRRLPSPALRARRRRVRALAYEHALTRLFALGRLLRSTVPTPLRGAGADRPAPTLEVALGTTG